MIIQQLKGDVTSPKVGIIGHGVNCQGVMGSGVALTIRNKFPKAYDAYLEHVANIDDKRDLLGTVQLVEIEPMLYVANMFTQFTFGRDGAKYASIQAVRDACAHLDLLRSKLVKQLYAAEIEVIQNLVTEMFSSPLGVTLSEGSLRQTQVRAAANVAVQAMTQVDKLDDPKRQYVLPIYLPLIGCGLGGLDWKTVEKSIDSHTGYSPVTIYHYQK